LSEQYNVSDKTIRRDSKLAETLSLIGGVSPEAKRKILSGEVTINKNKLETLSSAPIEKIEAVVAQIEEGTYERRGPRNPAPMTSDSILPEIKQLNGIIKNFASNFNSMFKQLNTGESVELKPILRLYIDELEDLYKSIND